MPKESDVKRLKERAAMLNKIANQAHSKVARHIAGRMAAEAERAANAAAKRTSGKSPKQQGQITEDKL